MHTVLCCLFGLLDLCKSCVWFVCISEARIRNLLAHTVNYLSNPISSDSTFARFLNIKAEVEVQVLRNALVSWGKRTPKTPDEPATFVSSLQHLKNVYGYLCDNLTPKVCQVQMSLDSMSLWLLSLLWEWVKVILEVNFRRHFCDDGCFLSLHGSLPLFM